MSLFENDDVKEILNSLIKIGEVSSVDCARGTARVVFDDDDNLVSNDLQVLQKNTIQNKDYYMPDVGEDVVCIFLPSGTEEGFILGSVYAGDITPPESSANKRTVKFADDTVISYDRAAHQLSISIGATNITANGSSVVIENPTIELKGNVNVSGTLTASGDVVGAGISLQNHTHTSAAPGDPTSPPQ